MKPVFVLDDGELIVTEALLSDMMYRIWHDTYQKIKIAETLHEAENAMFCYKIIEKRVVEVFRAHGLDRLEYLSDFREQIDEKFPPKENSGSESGGVISDDDVPF